MDDTVLLPQHNRYDYVPLTERRDYSWPGGKRLAAAAFLQGFPLQQGQQLQLNP